MAACAKVSLVSRLCEGKPGVMGDACARTSLGLFEICLGLLAISHTGWALWFCRGLRVLCISAARFRGFLLRLQRHGRCIV